ncbi:MAG: hypothetical protein ACOYYF_09210 [Chloroflexota bacterium]|nr:hypothetical protein [Chloroflexota bacterium]MBI5704254.1 hypothetical protein [Chloroflexota bacterium]
MNDVRKTIYGTIIGFFLMLGFWFSIVYVSACGFTFTCNRGQPLVERTPIPTLIPATMPVQVGGGGAAFNKCQIAAVDLIGAWVNAGVPETEKFEFTDVNGQTCEAVFSRDVQPLFTESNVWYPGSLSCTSCHHSNLAAALQNMDLSSYAGILAGSGRANGEPKGKDILGGGVWEQSLLYQMLHAENGVSTINRPLMPLGRSADVPDNGPLIFAGRVVTEDTANTSSTPSP